MSIVPGASKKDDIYKAANFIKRTPRESPARITHCCRRILGAYMALVIQAPSTAGWKETTQRKPRLHQVCPRL